MVSKLELAVYGPLQLLLSSILEFHSPSSGLGSLISLDLDLGILLPAANVIRHIVKGNFFFEELIHLTLDRIGLTLDDESSCVVDAAHVVEILVATGVTSHDPELRIEDVLPVASVLNTIINNQLDHNFLCVFAMERKILAVA